MIKVGVRNLKALEFKKWDGLEPRSLTEAYAYVEGTPSNARFRELTLPPTETIYRSNQPFSGIRGHYQRADGRTDRQTTELGLYQ